MDNKQFIALAGPLFATHPKVEAFYFTSDKMPHVSKKQAMQHATNTRKDGVVVTVTKDEITIAAEAVNAHNDED